MLQLNFSKPRAEFVSFLLPLELNVFVSLNTKINYPLQEETTQVSRSKLIATKICIRKKNYQTTRSNLTLNIIIDIRWSCWSTTVSASKENSFLGNLRERREIIFPMQKSQLVTGPFTNTVGIYLFGFFFPNPIQKRMENPIPNFSFSPFLGCLPNSTK